MVFFYVTCLNVLRKRYYKTAALNKDLGITGNVENSLDTKAEMSAAFSNALDSNQDPNMQTLSTISSTNTGQFLKVPDLPNEAQNTVARSKINKQQQQLRSLRTLGVVMIMFLVCWLPFCLFWPISAYCPDCIPLKVYEYSYWSAYLNSAINPFLYFMTNRDFRTALKKIFKCKK